MVILLLTAYVFMWAQNWLKWFSLLILNLVNYTNMYVEYLSGFLRACLDLFGLEQLFLYCSIFWREFAFQ